MTRYALVTSTGDSMDTIRRYLPANYTANVIGTFDRRVLITGEDDAGWTLDGYVIPRLSSGLIGAREVDDAERDALLEVAMLADMIEEEGLRGIVAPDF